jgi:hypothetical protein
VNGPIGMAGSSPVSSWDLLPALGFVEDETVISDQMPGLSFDFGNFKLSASRCLNRRFVPVVLLSGVMATKRSIGEVESELPLRFESVKQGMAWLAWCLDNAAGTRFAPASAPVWLAEGRRHRHLLGWERERAAYAARPHCYVQRDWARVALKTLAEQLENIDDDTPVMFRFDGHVLTISCAGRTIAMAAEGQPWTQPHSIRAGALRRLPKRLMREVVEVSVWDSALTIGNWRYSGVFAIEKEDGT